MKKYLAAILACLMVTICLSACNPTQKITTTSESIDDTKIISEMPEDFAFSFSYGIGAPNIIDTYKNMVQKDLISNGTASAEYHITNDDLNEVYSKIMALKLNEITQKMTSDNLKGVGYGVKPCGNYIIIFTMNGKRYTITGDDTAEGYIEENEQAAHFWEFSRYMNDFMRNTDEYKSLPQAKGGYE